MERVRVDVLGLFPVSDRDNLYLLVVMDYFTFAESDQILVDEVFSLLMYVSWCLRASTKKTWMSIYLSCYGLTVQWCRKQRC